MYPIYDHLWSGSHPASERLHILFELSAKKFPNKTAVVFQNESLSFRELNEKADGLVDVVIAFWYLVIAFHSFWPYLAIKSLLDSYIIFCQ